METRILTVNTKYIMKASFVPNIGALRYVPCRGILNRVQRTSKEDTISQPFLALTEHPTFFKEIVTGHPLAKKYHNNTPMFVDEEFEKGIKICHDLDEALSLIKNIDKYREEFYKLYASSLNAVNDYNFAQRQKRKERLNNGGFKIK